MVKLSRKLTNLFEGKIVYFATASTNAKPNLVCVVPNKVVGGKVIITDNMFNRTRKNLKSNPRASISFYYSDKAIQLKGKASYQTKGRWFKYVKSCPSNKGYSPKAAVVFSVKEVWDLDKGKRLV